MRTFSPREHFQTFDQESAAWIADESQGKAFLNAVNASLAQIAAEGASAEELEGIKRFISALLTIGRKDVERVKFPKRTLDVLDQHPDEPKPDER